jgi:hypothetical protein
MRINCVTSLSLRPNRATYNELAIGQTLTAILTSSSYAYLIAQMRGQLLDGGQRVKRFHRRS